MNNINVPNIMIPITEVVSSLKAVYNIVRNIYMQRITVFKSLFLI